MPHQTHGPTEPQSCDGPAPDNRRAARWTVMTLALIPLTFVVVCVAWYAWNTFFDDF